MELKKIAPLILETDASSLDFIAVNNIFMKGNVAAGCSF